MRNMLRTVALAGTLSSALYPQTLQAQNYDTWTLNREVLNSAANYTSVLTTAHREVRKYITWDWRTSLDEAAQQTRTDALLAEIGSSQQVNTNPLDLTVPRLDMTVLDSYAVRFRYCENTLLSYFDSTSFKHGLSAEQIIAAPVLRAQRTGITFNGEPLGIVAGEAVLGMRPPEIPTCMVTEENGGALAEGTVAYMTPAVRKLAARSPEPEQGTEPGSSLCPAPFTDGPEVFSQTREVKRSWRFADSKHLQDFPALRKAETVTYGEWETSDDGCYRTVNEPPSKTKQCPPGQDGNGFRKVLTVPGKDYRDGAKGDIEPTYGPWRAVGSACRYIPPAPPPPPPSGCAAHAARYAWKAYEACQTREQEKYGRSGGGGNGYSGRDGGVESVDVDGDGVGDYSATDSRGWGGTDVQGGCGACGGPRGGNVGSGRGRNDGNDGPSGGGSGRGGGGRSGGGGCGCRGADRDR